ncbi:MAG: ATP-binding protein [bacterium]
MRFSSVIGQSAVRERLKAMVRDQRLSHALLFLGREGTGGLPLAMAFAQYLCCDQVTGRGGSKVQPANASLFGEPETTPAASSETLPDDSCGTCPACVKAAGLMHPDIHFTYPTISKKSGTPSLSSDFAAEWREFVKLHPYGNDFDWLQFIGAENKQGNITAAECNEIVRVLSLKSFEQGYKIHILWMPEYLGTEGNKLLKLIEEPPPNTLFLLVAQDDARILATILSRTQLVRIPPLDQDTLAAALLARTGVTEQQAMATSVLADGNYREAISILQHNEEDWQSMTRDWFNAILRGGPVAQVNWVEEISNHGREKQNHFLLYVNHLLAQSIRLRSLGDRAPVMQDNEKDFAGRLNKMASISQQQAMVEELDRAAYQIERNANPKILFLALSIRFWHIIRDNSLILME